MRSIDTDVWPKSCVPVEGNANEKWLRSIVQLHSDVVSTSGGRGCLESASAITQTVSTSFLYWMVSGKLNLRLSRRKFNFKSIKCSRKTTFTTASVKTIWHTITVTWERTLSCQSRTSHRFGLNVSSSYFSYLDFFALIDHWSFESSQSAQVDSARYHILRSSGTCVVPS